MNIKPKRLPLLDGWRAISILLVLSAHLVPLGPAKLQLNSVAGLLGMALFFTLSGFLITQFLLDRPAALPFLIRRLCRIVPLAWFGMLIGLWQTSSETDAVIAHLAFYANLPPFWLTSATAHFWSVCVEVQFYLFAAIGILIFGRRYLWLLPLAGIAITAMRIYFSAPISIVTYFRVDEIFAGVTVCLIWNSQTPWLTKFFSKFPIWLAFPLAALACHPDFNTINYLRPYLVALLIALSLHQRIAWLDRTLTLRSLKYIAAISFALYVFHPLLMHSWLGTGDPIVKYAKRPLLFVALWAVAHLSTFYYEAWWIKLGKNLTRR
jgi:peptidoglycan/LPS O-acetylase OafA/YrhL